MQFGMVPGMKPANVSQVWSWSGRVWNNDNTQSAGSDGLCSQMACLFGWSGKGQEAPSRAVQLWLVLWAAGSLILECQAGPVRVEACTACLCPGLDVICSQCCWAV